MKKLMLVCCFVIGATVASFAQGGGQRGMRSPEEQVKQLQTQLKLTDDQVTKATVILTASSKRMDSLRTAANGDFQSMMTKMQPIRKDQTDKINALLTADQKTEYKKILDAQAERMRQFQNGGGQGGGGGTPPPPPPPAK